MLLDALHVLPYPVTFELLEVDEHAIRGRIRVRRTVWVRNYMHAESRDLCHMLAQTLRHWYGRNVYFDLVEGGGFSVFY